MRWRPVEDDGEALVELFGRLEIAESGHAGTTSADVRDLLATPGLDLEARTCVAESSDGRLAGFAALHPAPQPGQLRAHLSVAPDAPTGTAETLLRRLDEWAADGSGPVTMFQLPTCLLHDQLVSHGWTIVHSYTRLTVELDAAPTRVARTNPRVTVRAAADESDQRTIHAVLEDAIAGHWNHDRRDFAEFDLAQREREGYDPALWWLAEVDGAPAGAVIARDPAERAWIAWLGVLDAHRGQGIGKMLLHTAFSQLRERGHRTVGVDVDTHNSTGAVIVYKATGMSVLGTADQWRKIYP
ncbi:MAG TPA: GNAT family N-acetyltransferase [Actinospica sp.]|nr:GNAT family N-acetyltransferase [Actinospica sp.]